MTNNKQTPPDKATQEGPVLSPHESRPDPAADMHLANGVDGNWRASWLLGVLCFACCLATYEIHLRKEGHLPRIVDDEDLWCLHRERAVGADDKTVVLIGASRILLGFSSRVFNHWFPEHQLIQLAIDGSRGRPTLEDLAHDQSFRGVVIYSATAASLTPEANGPQQRYIDHYHKQWRGDRRLNRLISLWLQQHLTLMHPSQSLVANTKRLVRDQRLRPVDGAYLDLLSDRSVRANYGVIDYHDHRAERIERARRTHSQSRTPTATDWRSDIERLKASIKAIHNRGGKVVVVRFPTTSEHWLLDESLMPRAKYWDEMAVLLGTPTLHFQDMSPRARYLDCPDTSHLDRMDAEIFTAILLEELIQRQVLPEQQMPKDLNLPERQFWPRSWHFRGGNRLIGRYVRQTDDHVKLAVRISRDTLTATDNKYIDNQNGTATERPWGSNGQQGVLTSATPTHAIVVFEYPRASFATAEHAYLAAIADESSRTP